jgi:hypothetical protein
MKLFVTDAQMAALRDAAYAAAQMDMRAHRQHYESEIARLREDRTAELARLADPQGPFVAHLIAEVAHWRLLHADISVDQRLAERGLGPVTLPPRPLVPEPAVDLMADLLKNTEFAAMGDARGVAQ